MARDYSVLGQTDAPIDRITMPEGQAADRIVIANTHLLFTANFKKSGADLILTGEDGKKLVVTDYFKHERLPDLAAPGGAFLSGDLVERLAGPEHPGQYAQAGAPSGAPIVGRVERVGGNATVQHSNGVVEQLKIGDNILQGDIVETRDGSALGLSFIDGSAFNMGAGARMSINELVYDSNSTSNSAVFSVIRGAISFVAGQAAKTGDMRVETPVATMGIRGTTVSTRSDIDVSNPVCMAAIDPTAMPDSCVVSFSSSLLTDPDGHVGGFNLINRLTNAVMRSVTTTDTIVVMTPVAGTMTAQVKAKSPEQVAQDLNDAQVLFPMFLANPANFNVNTPPPDIKPQGPSEHGSSTPQGGNVQTQQTETVVFIPPLPPEPPKVLAGSNETTNGNSNNTPPVIKFAPTVTADTPPNLVEATSQGSNPADPGTPASIVHISKADQDGTVTYDTTGWASVGNGIFSKDGAFGTAFLDTNANTLTYQLDETKADPLGQNDHLTESFVVNVVDNDGQHATTTVVFTVDGRNDPPAVSVATNIVSLDENTSVDITGIHVSDPEPTDDIATTFHVAHGTLTPLANGNFPGAGTDTVTIHTSQSLDAVIAAGFRYTPNANYAGNDTLEIDASDGHGGTQHQEIAITVNSTVGQPETLPTTDPNGLEGVAEAVVLGGFDNDGTVTGFRIVDVSGLHGTLFSDSNLTHQVNVGDIIPADFTQEGFLFLKPEANFTGDTSFTFAAIDNDGKQDSTPATATVHFTSVNDPPVASDDGYTAAAGHPFTSGNSVLDNDTDVDGDSLTAILASQPVFGQVVLNSDGTFVYTPNAGFTGSDFFGYYAFDGHDQSNLAFVNIAVNLGPNVPPQTSNVTASGNEDSVIAVTLSGTDSDGSVVSFRITDLTGLKGLLYSDSNLTHQLNVDDLVSASGGAATVYFRPDQNANGSTSFGFAAHDDRGDDDGTPATAAITIDPVNDPPSALDGVAAATENQSYVGNALASDVDSPALFYGLSGTNGGAQHGTVTMGTDGAYVYTPDTNFFGNDTFFFTATDGIATSNIAHVDVTVAHVNVAPDTFDALNSGLEDHTIAVSLGGSDPDGTVQSFRITNIANLHGNIYSDSGLTHLLGVGDTVSVGSGGTATVYFHPDQDSSGTAQFNFAAVDNNGLADPSPALATIDVTAVNDAPVFVSASAGSTYLTGGPPVPVATNVFLSDVDNANFNGGSFVATVTQGGHQGDILSIADNAFISLNSTAVMFDADGAGSAFTPIVIGSLTDNLSSLEIDLNANADSAAIEALTQAITFQNTTATPTSDTRTVTFTLVDGSGTADGGHDTGQFDATVNSAGGTNQAPVSNNDFYTTAENVTLNVSAPGVLSNDTDTENDQLFAFELTRPAHGTLTLMPDGSFFYSPDQDFVGADTFTYAAFDGFSHGNQIISNNLIVNPGAELGTAATDFTHAVVPQGWTASSGWTSTSGFTALTYAAGAVDPTFLGTADSAALGPPLGSQDGGLAYFSGGPANATSSIFQIIDVSSYGADIDLGLVQALLSADLGGYTGQEDNIVLTAHYLATANAASDLGHTILTGPPDLLRHDYATALSLPDATLLMPEGGFDVIPVGTRFIEIELTSTRTSGNYNDGYADNLSLQLLDFASTGNVATVTVDVTGPAVNTAPVLADDTPTLDPITSNDVNNAGQSVASILGSDVTDPDGPGTGIAITDVTSLHGHWEYQLDGTGPWTTISASDDAALVLSNTDFVRFVPNPGSTGTDSFTYHAWDHSDGLSSGDSADLTNPANVGGAGAYSVSADTAAIEITVPQNSPPSVDIIGTFDLIENGVDANNFPIGFNNQQLDLIVSDPDSGDTTSLDPTGWFQSGNVFSQEGTYGALIFDSNESGMLSYQLSDSNPLTQALKAGDHVTDQFDITFTDNHGASTTKHVVVDITGSNDAPVTEGDKVVGFDSNDLSPIDLRIATPTDYENDALTVQIAAVPVAGFGQILLDGNAVAAGAILTPAEFTRLQFQSSSAGNGGISSALTYSVSDLNGGITTNTIILSDSAVAAQSATLQFDEGTLPVTHTGQFLQQIPNGYGAVGTFAGFIWSSVGVVSSTDGYPNPFSSPNTAWGLSAVIASLDGSEFSINSLEIARFSGADFVTLTGTDFGVQVGTVTINLGSIDFTNNWILEAPNFGPITQLSIQAIGPNSSSAFWKMDDFSFTTVHDILGGFGSDVLVGDSVDDRFRGSFNNDVFVYATGGHADTILDFAPGLDRISLQGVTSVHSMSDIGPLASQQGADTFIDFGNGDTLTLKNVDLNSLTDSDFLFSPGITGDLAVQLVKGGSTTITSLDLQQIEGSDPNLTFTVQGVQHGHLVRTDTSQTLFVGDHFTQAQIDAGIIAFAADDTIFTGTGAGFKVSVSDGLAGSQPATVVVTASVFDAQINITTDTGIDFDVEDPIAKMGAGVVTPDVADPTHRFTILNQAANRDFTFIGSGFTYSGSGNAIAVTGGVLLAMQEFDHTTHAQIMEVTLNVSAAAWYNAALAKAAGDGNALESLTDNWSVEFVGAGGIDAFQSGNGQDFFTSSGGNDLIDGGEDLDRVSYTHATGPINVQLADGVVTGDASVGTDTLRSIEFVAGTNFADTFNAGATTLNPGGFSQNSTNAGSGASGNPNFNDFEGRGGDDQIVGNGSTRVSYVHSTSAVTVDVAAGTADGDASVGHDTFSGVNQVRGSAYGDHIFGSSNPTNTFENLEGRGGDDFIDGRSGFDRSVYLFDGPLADGATGIHVDLAAGTVVGGSDTGSDTLRSIEGITGTNFNDTYDAHAFTGSGAGSSVNAGDSGPNGASSNFNEFEGAGGNDTITGNGSTRIAYYNATSGVVVQLNGTGGGTSDGASTGHDVIVSGVTAVRGSEYNDIILGGSQNETLEGRGGDDVLDGRGGNDRLIGGSGADIFAYDSLGNYRVDDFNRSEGDRIDLRGAGIASIATLALTRGTFASGTFTPGASGPDTQITGFGSGKSVAVLGQLPASFSPSDFIFTNTVSVSVHTPDGYDFVTLYDDMAASAAQQTQNTTTHLFAVDAAKGITFEMIATSGSPFVLDANHLPISGTIGEIDILDTTNLNDPTLLTQSHILVSTDGWTMPAASLFNAIGEYASVNPATHTQGLTDLNNIFNAGKYSIVGSGGSQSNDGTPHDGADVFFGGNGADVFNGLGGPFGPGDHGSDTVDYSHATAAVTASLQSPASNIGAAQGDIYISIENLRGSDFGDTLTGDGNNNVLEGSLGTNTLDGAGGNNTASYAHAASAVTVSLAIGGAQNSIGAGTDTLINIQNLRGSNFDDHLTGDGNANILTGSHGNDTLTGGAGNDTFVFVNGDGHDTIADFIIGQDKVDLTDGHTAAQVQALIDATTAGSNTLDLGNGNILTFTGIDVHNQLHAATDFLVH